jgi:excisionase family DNA binding protein
MHRRLQFGMRENPASHRRHGPRSEVGSLSNGTCSENPSSPELPVASANSSLNAAPPHAATREGGDDASARHAIPARPRSLGMTPAHFEPLIGSSEAARLLGDIHVKTLQRYARQRRIPGYQIGGHWYFRVSELDSWLRPRINSNCQPAGRVDFTQEESQ